MQCSFPGHKGPKLCPRPVDRAAPGTAMLNTQAAVCSQDANTLPTRSATYRARTPMWAGMMPEEVSTCLARRLVAMCRANVSHKREQRLHLTYPVRIYHRTPGTLGQICLCILSCRQRTLCRQAKLVHTYFLLSFLWHAYQLQYHTSSQDSVSFLTCKKALI